MLFLHDTLFFQIIYYLSLRLMGFRSFFWYMADADVNRTTGGLCSCHNINEAPLNIWKFLSCFLGCLQHRGHSVAVKSRCYNSNAATVATVCIPNPMSTDCLVRKCHSSVMSNPLLTLNTFFFTLILSVIDLTEEEDRK